MRQINLFSQTLSQQQTAGNQLSRQIAGNAVNNTNASRQVRGYMDAGVKGAQPRDNAPKSFRDVLSTAERAIDEPALQNETDDIDAELAALSEMAAINPFAAKMIEAVSEEVSEETSEVLSETDDILLADLFVDGLDAEPVDELLIDTETLEAEGTFVLPEADVDMDFDPDIGAEAEIETELPVVDETANQPHTHAPVETGDVGILEDTDEQDDGSAFEMATSSAPTVTARMPVTESAEPELSPARRIENHESAKAPEANQLQGDNDIEPVKSAQTTAPQTANIEQPVAAEGENVQLPANEIPERQPIKAQGEADEHPYILQNANSAEDEVAPRIAVPTLGNEQQEDGGLLQRGDYESVAPNDESVNTLPKTGDSQPMQFVQGYTNQQPAANAENTAPAADTNLPVTPNDAAQNFTDIVERITTAHQSGTNSLEISLRPEHLGRVSITLTMAENGLTAQIRTSNTDTRAMIASQITTLEQSLRDRGIEVVHMDVVYTELPKDFGGDTQRQDFRGERKSSVRVVREEAVEVYDIYGGSAGLDSGSLDIIA